MIIFKYRYSYHRLFSGNKVYYKVIIFVDVFNLVFSWWFNWHWYSSSTFTHCLHYSFYIVLAGSIAYERVCKILAFHHLFPFFLLIIPPPVCASE